MQELENQIKIQSENLNKISALANKKEEKLNNDISDYLQQINDLKSELELLNSTITNLTEEKENNTIKLTELIHENEQLKKNKLTSTSKSDTHNKKYEEIILKLKKNIMSLNEEKKALEEVIIKQEEKVNELSYKVNDREKKLIVKDKELKDSIEYTAKLTSAINSQKKEIQILKQNNTNNKNKNNNNNEEAVSILRLQNEIQNIKKELENKDNKINLLSMSNKILQGKVNKLSQTAKNGFNNNSINNNNQNINNGNTIIIKDNKENKYNNFNYISGVLPKTLDKNNHQIPDLKSSQGVQNVTEKKKLYIVAKSKELPKTPGKANARQNSLGVKAKNELYKNVEEINKMKNQNHQLPNTRNNSHAKNMKRTSNYNNINDVHENNNNINKNNKLIDKKYKEIESKYKNEKKEKNKIKDDTLFDEDINNIDIKEEIISPNENEKIDLNIASIQINSNMVSQTLKPEIHKKNNNEMSVNMSQDKEFQVIESYCVLSGQDNTINNTENNTSAKNGGDKVDDSKIEALQIQNLHNKVNQILNEF